MAEFFASSFWTGFLWPLIVMVAQSVLLLVVLLVAIAYIGLAGEMIRRERGVQAAVAALTDMHESVDALDVSVDAHQE